MGAEQICICICIDCDGRTGDLGLWTSSDVFKSFNRELKFNV